MTTKNTAIEEAKEKAAEKYFGHNLGNGTEYHAFTAGFNRGVEAGRAANWHPISEGLPDDEGRFLMTYKWPYRNDVGPFVMEVEYFPEGEDPLGWHQPNIADEFEVIAWAELPEPYKEPK